MRDLSIHVTYGTQTTILNCPRTSFLSKVAECFEIDEDIIIYDRKRGLVITEEDLTDVMKVEIKKVSEVNRESPVPSTSKDSKYAELIVKLRDKLPLTGQERKYFVECLKNKETKNQKSSKSSKSTRNIKLQVNPDRLIPRISVATQTDHLINHVPKKRSLTSEGSSKRNCVASTSRSDPIRIKEIMDETYDERRSCVLLKLPLVKDLKQKYPLLFSLTEVRNEIDRIFHQGKADLFIRNIEKYAVSILSLAREDDPLLITIKNEASVLKTIRQKKYALEVGSILMLSSLLHEDRTYLKLRDQPFEIPNFPYIEAEADFGDLFPVRHSFKMYVEGCELCEAPDFKEALLGLVGAYYIFSIEYPDMNWNTFTAFDLLYVERHDVEDLDEFTAQIIKSVQLKAEASGANSIDFL